ncbi:hypothetical protein ZY50_25540 [Salmonella enterica subsp. enterica]|nr:hypothetical protein [Salmonella enterica subsp. enterica serovar Newport]EAB5694715.1 hypothetical protein [Salmonella enterica subsp. enterica serovar Newport]EBU6996863.1 hypothetical protein [Salmonella enterica subsp. enterica serovar Newport]EEB7957271.1 hypothetical protein [Salmonella enterica subsp. enterica serovar Newport]
MNACGHRVYRLSLVTERGRRQHGENWIRGPPGKRKISYAKPVFCTDYYSLSVMRGIYPVRACLGFCVNAFSQK